MKLFPNNVLTTLNQISLPEKLGKEHAALFESESNDWHSLECEVHILDFKQVKSIQKLFYPAISAFKKKVEMANAQIHSINISPEILSQLKSDGVDKVFGYYKTNAKVPASKPLDSREEMRSWMIKYAVEAARNAMNMMFNSTVAADENYRESSKNFDPTKFYKVAVMRGQGVRVRAIFRLFFERKTLEALTKTISDSTQTSPDEELLLSIATELCNIIYTTTKSRVNDERGYDLPGAIPTLMDPAKIAKDGLSIHDTSWIPLITPLGPYYLQIEITG